MVVYGDHFRTMRNSNHHTSRSCSWLLHVYPLISFDLMTFPTQLRHWLSVTVLSWAEKRRPIIRKRHTDEQIIAVLKDAKAGVSVQELCRKHGISDAMFCKWRTIYAGLEVLTHRYENPEDSLQPPNIELVVLHQMRNLSSSGRRAGLETDQAAVVKRRLAELLSAERL